jgi:adenylate kinase family enzyme
MDKTSMKIAIIGNAGSGKSTLGFRLHEKLGIPLYQWGPGWQRLEKTEFEKKHNELCDRDAWIMDGLGIRFFNYRIDRADVIIFLDVPTSTCLWRVIKRSVLNWGKVIPGNPEGCKQQLFSFKFVEFLHWVWSFNKRYREQIMLMLDAARSKKQVYVARTQKEIDAMVALLGKNELNTSVNRRAL